MNGVSFELLYGLILLKTETNFKLDELKQQYNR